MRDDLSDVAFVLVDLNNDGLHDDGWARAVGGDPLPARALVPLVSAAVSKVRAAGALIVWTNWAVRPDLAEIPEQLAAAYRRAGNGIGLGDLVPGRGHRAMTAGSWGSQVYDGLTVDPADVEVGKNRVSAFFGSGLDSVLRRHQRTTLLFAGINLDQCVLQSLIDAATLGYECLLVADLCATSSPTYCAQAALYNVSTCYGRVIATHQLGAALGIPTLDVVMPGPPSTSPPPAEPALDTTMWQVLGDPLIAATRAGPLSGSTVAVKDLIAVAGNPIGAGVPRFRAQQGAETASAPVVQRLLDAGAAVVGVAATDEFAYSLTGINSHYGTPPNPRVPDSVSGGSSSGPASAVAAGLVDIGLGTDTAGSIRVPASYQGLVGLRTSHGVVDLTGVVELAPAFDAIGWLTNGIELCSAVATVLLPDRSGVAPILNTLRSSTLDASVAPEIAECVRSRADELVAARVLPPYDELELSADQLDRWSAAFRTVQAYQAWQQHGDWITRNPGALGPDVAARFAFAARVTQHEFEEALGVLATARSSLTAQLTGRVLVLPSAATTAPPRGAASSTLSAARDVTIRLTCLASLAGAPALSLPLCTVGSKPLGFGLVAAPGADHALLALGAGLVPAS